MAKRGEYAAINTSIVDRDAFRAFSPDAKLLSFLFRMMLGASGIDVVRALEVQLHEMSGLPYDRLIPALNELQNAGEVVRQGAVVWLRDGLRDNATLTLANPKQRQGVLNHLAGLPESAILNAFADCYGLGEVAPGKGIEWVSIPYAIPEYGIRNPVTEQKPCATHMERRSGLENGGEHAGQGERTAADEPHRTAESQCPESGTAPDAADVAARDDAQADTPRPPLRVLAGSANGRPPAEPTVHDGAPPAADATDEPARWRGEAAAAIREHLWLGKNPPPMAVTYAKREGKRWDMGRELSIWRNLARADGYEAATGAIAHVRAALGAEPDAPLSLRIVNDRERRGFWSVAVGTYRKRAERTAVAGNLGDILSGIGAGHRAAGGRRIA